MIFPRFLLFHRFSGFNGSRCAPDAAAAEPSDPALLSLAGHFARRYNEKLSIREEKDASTVRFQVQTFGCQMNVYDSGVIERLLREAGHRPVENEAEADIILVNTCCVRDSAENRVYGHLGHLKKCKEAGPLRVLGICGCMAQSHAERLFERAPFLDLVIGTDAYPRIVELIDAVLAEDLKQCDTTFYAEQSPDEDESSALLDWEPYPVGSARFTPGDVRYPMFLPIMRGCDYGCTYCVVPAVRGREICRSPLSILREVRTMTEAGARAVTLIGQVVNAYEYGETSFASLLRQVAEIDELERVLFVTSHPRKFDAEIIDTVAGSDRIVRYFHIPVQSGCDKILRRMARGYTVQAYEDLVRQIRSRIPHAAITSDLIVGFPGETDQDFEETLEFTRGMRLHGIFSFRYSPRAGTPATDFPDQVPEPVKIQRLERLNEIQKQISTEINQPLEGTIQEVFVEQPGDNLRGRTWQNKATVFPRVDGVLPGDTVRVRINRAGAYTLYGEIVTGDSLTPVSPAHVGTESSSSPSGRSGLQG
jgi:tRNA-2-methylthio-N6-dimethylallyladenosine synthase